MQHFHTENEFEPEKTTTGEPSDRSRGRDFEPNPGLHDLCVASYLFRGGGFSPVPVRKLAFHQEPGLNLPRGWGLGVGG